MSNNEPNPGGVLFSMLTGLVESVVMQNIKSPSGNASQLFDVARDLVEEGLAPKHKESKEDAAAPDEIRHPNLNAIRDKFHSARSNTSEAPVDELSDGFEEATVAVTITTRTVKITGLPVSRLNEIDSLG